MGEDISREKIVSLFRALNSAAQSVTIYGASHSNAEKSADELFALLRELFCYQDEIAIGIFANELFFEKTVIFSPGIQLQSFINELQSKGIGRIIFNSKLGRAEISGFLNVITRKQADLSTNTAIVDCLLAEGVENIGAERLGSGLSGRRADDFRGESAGELFRGQYDASMAKAGEVLNQAIEGRLSFSQLKAFSDLLISLVVKNRTLLLVLSAINEHDEYTLLHSVDVSLLVMLQAQGLGFEDRIVSDFGMAAFLHDVGKLSLPPELIRKTSALTESEFEIIKMHTAAGARIVNNIKGVGRLPVVVAFEHHIRYDLMGYPKIDYSYRPHLVSQLTTIADYYDSLRSNRAYKKEYPSERVYQMMDNESGKYFHPALLKNFFSIVGVWSPGTIVELSNGMTAFVLENSPDDIFSPSVLVPYDEGGNKLSEPLFFDLSQSGPAHSGSVSTENIRIVRSVFMDPKEVRDKYLTYLISGF